MKQQVRIAIVGAGLSGLALTAVLHANGILASIFELDASPAARRQGGQLDIHAETGQQALRAAHLHEAFLRIIHPGAQAMRVLDRNNVLLHASIDDGGGERPEVDRGQLRRLLLDALPNGMIRWGKKLVDVMPLADAQHTLRFADGSEAACDLLVGGDGAWSRIRPCVSDAKPVYSGISFVECYLPDAAERQPACARLVGSGSMLALAPDHGILAHKENDGSLHIYVAVRAPERWLSTVDFQNTIAAKRALLARFAGWSPQIRAVIEQAEGELTPRHIHALPIGHRWVHQRGVTLLGDAAHLMSPFAGEGANLALFDGAELGRMLVQHRGDTDAAVCKYEAAMFVRSQTSAQQSAQGIELCFGPQAPHKLVDFFAEG